MQDTADQLQSTIGEELFPNQIQISDVKQVLEEMESKSQELSQDQVKAITLLNELGKNEYLHKENPYTEIIKWITEKAKVMVASPDVYIDTIEALIPKPPKPVILTEKGKPIEQPKRR